ncbi:RNA-binding protein 12, partial [Orchesella cincta]
IKEFIRVEVMGGSDGVVRLYDEGIAFLKLENPSEFPRVYRSNGRKLRGSAVSIEGITMEIWTQEYKLNKSRIERDIDREKEERERERERDSGRPSRDRERDNSNASQSSCIAIRGLAPTITRQELITRYLNETPCQDVVLIAAPTPTNRHSVTAFVEFESAQIAKSVTDSITRSPFGASLVVESCDSDDLQKAKARTSGSSAMAPSGGVVSSVGSRGDRDSRIPMQAAAGSTPDKKSIFELELGLDDETTTVIMKGAPPNISERDVFDFFSDIGLTPTNVRIMYDSDGQCSGQVICEFPDNNKAKRATTKDGMLFGRGQISVSLLPNRSRVSGGSVEPAPQQNSFLRDFSQQRPRTGLLGSGPLRGAPAGMNSSPRFPNPNNNSPNIFEQALQQQSGPVRPPPPLGSGRGRGGPNGTGERMSRFNNARSDFRGNGMGRGRGAGGPGKKDENQTMSDDEMALFNKKGCVLGLENIPYKASMDDILGYLEDKLKIRIAPDRIIRRYDEMQKPTGDARVAFDTEFEAKLACERLNGTYMWKRLISSAVIE